jgi:hypothetical protein
MRYLIVRLLTLCLLVVTMAGPVGAQCPMCKMSAESNMKNGGTAGRGLNAGILYMLAAPYLIVAGVGVWWYRNRRKEQSPED